MAQFHSFLWLYSIVYMYHIFFIHSSINRHLGCCHVLATVNSAAMNTGVHVSFGAMVFSGSTRRSRIAEKFRRWMMVRVAQQCECAWCHWIIQLNTITMVCFMLCDFYHNNFFFFLMSLFQKRASLSSVGEESACNAGDPGLIPGSWRSPRKGIGDPLQYSWASLMVQLVRNPPATWEAWVQSLGWEDPLEKGKVTHSNTLAWRIPWTVWSMELQRVRHDCATFTFSQKNAVSLEERGRLSPTRGTKHLSFGLLLRQWTGVVGAPVAAGKPSRQKVVL